MDTLELIFRNEQEIFVKEITESGQERKYTIKKKHFTFNHSTLHHQIKTLNLNLNLHFVNNDEILNVPCTVLKNGKPYKLNWKFLQIDGETQSILTCCYRHGFIKKIRCDHQRIVPLLKRDINNALSILLLFSTLAAMFFDPYTWWIHLIIILLIVSLGKRSYTLANGYPVYLKKNASSQTQNLKENSLPQKTFGQSLTADKYEHIIQHSNQTIVELQQNIEKRKNIQNISNDELDTLNKNDLETIHTIQKKLKDLEIELIELQNKEKTEKAKAFVDTLSAEIDNVKRYISLG